jgi:hypothetical protein
MGLYKYPFRDASVPSVPASLQTFHPSCNVAAWPLNYNGPAARLPAASRLSPSYSRAWRGTTGVLDPGVRPGIA